MTAFGLAGINGHLSKVSTLLAAALAAFLLAACSSSISTTPVPTALPTASVSQPSAIATPTHSPGNDRREVVLVKAVRPTLTTLVATLEKRDVVAAKNAYEAYDSAWNGIEVYVNFRSPALYSDLETELQAKVEDGLASSAPRPADVLASARALLAKYDEAIALVENGSAISPIFDDVADIRIARSHLRLVNPALQTGEMAKAKSEFGKFQDRWQAVEGLIKLRSADAYQEIDDAISQVDITWRKSDPTAAELMPLVTALTARYNFGLNLANTATRNANIAKTTWTAEDAAAAAKLSVMAEELKLSLARWESSDYAGSAQHAGQATSALFNSVAPQLKTRNADVSLKTALDACAALAGQAGDTAKVRAANRSALDATYIAQQSLVGQFWTDEALQAAIKAPAQ